MISFIPQQYTLRTQELVFELHLRELYPERNIVSFCETDEVSGRVDELQQLLNHPASDLPYIPF